MWQVLALCPHPCTDTGAGYPSLPYAPDLKEMLPSIRARGLAALGAVAGLPIEYFHTPGNAARLLPWHTSQLAGARLLQQLPLASA
jgi:hypothetical protein